MTIQQQLSEINAQIAALEIESDNLMIEANEFEELSDMTEDYQESMAYLNEALAICDQIKVIHQQISELGDKVFALEAAQVFEEANKITLDSMLEITEDDLRTDNVIEVVATEVVDELPSLPPVSSHPVITAWHQVISMGKKAITTILDSLGIAYDGLRYLSMCSLVYNLRLV